MLPINLAEVVKGAVGTQMPQIQLIIDESMAVTSPAVHAGIDALIAGLRENSSTSGPSRLLRYLDQHDGSVIENLNRLLNGGNHFGLLDMGNSVLSVAFGPKVDQAVADLENTSGLNAEKCKTLLQLTGPIVLGVMGRHQRSHNLSPQEVAGLLTKSNHEASQPALPRSSEATQIPAANPFPNSETQPSQLALSLIPLFLLAGLAFWGYHTFSGAKPELDKVAEVQLAEFDDLRSKLESLIRDIQSASDGAAAEKLQPQFEAVTAAANATKSANSSEWKNQLTSGAIGQAAAQLNDALDSAYESPGVKAVLQPIAAPLLRKLSGD